MQSQSVEFSKLINFLLLISEFALSTSITGDKIIAPSIENDKNFRMVSIFCKSSFTKAVEEKIGSSSVFLQIKTLVEMEKRSYYANVFSNCSSTPSKISFDGLPSKSKRSSIRKQIVAIITVISIVFTKQPSAERYFSKHFFPIIFVNF